MYLVEYGKFHVIVAIMILKFKNPVKELCFDKSITPLEFCPMKQRVIKSVFNDGWVLQMGHYFPAGYNLSLPRGASYKMERSDWIG